MPEHMLATLRRVRVMHVLVCLPWLVLLAWLAGIAWFLTDDAFISFRYVRNLLNGDGLVFNPGEYVEGYTNFLWVLELTAIWGLFGIRPEQAAPWLSVACTVGTIAAMLWWVARTPTLRNRALVGWMALGLLCSSATFAVWTSGGGLETRQFTFFVVLAVVCLGVHANSPRGLLAASLSLAVAALTRPEGILLAGCCFGWFIVVRLAGTGRLAWRDMTLLIGPWAVTVAVHFVFRYGYYGDWLPNTYYAKHVRPWYESGFRYLAAAALETGLYVLLPLAFVALWQRWRRWRDATYALVLVCILAHMAYLARIGGDLFEYRPLDFYWPLLMVPGAEALAYLGSGLSARLGRIRWLSPGLGPWVCAVVLFAPVLFYSGAMQAVLLLEGDARRGREEAFWLPTTLDEYNADRLLAGPGMRALVAASNELREQSIPRFVGLRFALYRKAVDRRTQEWKPYETLQSGLIPDDAVTAFASLGVSSYYLRDLKIIDIYGLTDATVARNPVGRPNRERQMAHDRRPPEGYLQQRGVNFHPAPAASNVAEAFARANYAVPIGPAFWMPFNVADHQWANERFADRGVRARNRFAQTEPAANRFRVGTSDGLLYVGEQFLGRFERDMEGWRVQGEAVTNHGRHAFYTSQLPIFGYVGPGFLTSYHPDKGDAATGEAFSPEFTAQAGQSLAFLLAGGPGRSVGLRLLADGENVAVWYGAGEWRHISGERAEKFDLIVYPLSAVSGKRLQLQLFDYEPGQGGHIMLDHVMLVRPCLALDELIGGRKPVIRSGYDVYINDDELIYVKGTCSQDDADTLFSLHWAPADEAHLADYWREYGFNVRDFRFEEYGVKSGSECVVVVPLPAYAISQIKTGQFVYGPDEELVWLWRDSVRLDEQPAGHR